MRRFAYVFLGILMIATLIAGPVVYAVQQQSRMRNFRVVREGALYRSGQMHPDGLKRAIHDYGIKTVISLRDSPDGYGPAPDKAEESFCRQEELSFYRFSPRGWDSRDGAAPAEENVKKFLAIVRNPRNQPVLIHCFAGIHRTGAYCAVYRMEEDQWVNARAIAEAMACGYAHLNEELDILGYLEKYRPAWQAKEK
jgi:tyrosine-protein phosphatase SIW14